MTTLAGVPAVTADASEVSTPCRAVDAVVVHGGGPARTIRARKLVDAADPYLVGHFPGMTIYPGVLIIEGVRQAVGAGLGGACHIVALCSVRFYAPAVPGDLLLMDVAVDPDAGGTLSVRAEVGREDDAIRVAKMVLTVRIGGATDV